MQNAFNLTGLGIHHERLENIGGHGDDRGDEARAHARREMSEQVVLKVFRAQEALLELVVKGELSDRDKDTAQRGHVEADVEAREALGSSYSVQSFEAVLVVSSLIGCQFGIVLHANVYKISRRAFWTAIQPDHLKKSPQLAGSFKRFNSPNMEPIPPPAPAIIII